MFRIFCDGVLIYHSNLESLQIFDPSLELELNKTGSFVFTLYPDHPRYSLVKRLKSIIQVFQDDFLLFRGRVLDEEVGWHNEKTFSCEGELAFLLDTIQRPYDFTGSIPEFLGMLLSNHNAQTDPEKVFTLGNVTVTDPNDYIVRSDIDYVNTWDVITKKLVDVLGGFLQVRHVDGVNYLDYLAESTLLAPQKITFGKNLLDLKRTRKGEDIATAIIPLGAKLQDTDQRLTIESVNGGLDYLVDEDAVNDLGIIFKTVIFDDVTDPSNLKTKGQAQLSDSVKQWETLDLTAADLATVNKDITSFHLGTMVAVESNPHGLNQRFRVEKLSLKLLDPAANKMTLGKTIKAFSEVVVFQKGDPGQPGQPGTPGKDGKDGVNGKDGKDGVGVASITEQYYLSTSATSLSGGSWSGSVPNWVDGRFMWTRSVIAYTNGSTSTTNAKCVTGAKGSTGTAGSAGKDGISITNVDVMYYQSTSSTSLAGGTWVTTAPSWIDGRFFWEKTVVTYSNGTTDESTPVCISGQKGATGATGSAGRDGVDGKDGVGVSSITEQYYLSTSATSQTGGSWSGTVPTWADGRYMWTRSVITYTNGTSNTTNPKCVTGAKGSTGSAGSPGSNGKDGISITKVDVMYYQSTSSTALVGGSWVTTAPAWVDGRFFWEKTVVTYSDGTTDESTPVCITGQRGLTGATGATGAKGDPGSPGADGKNGKDAAIHSLTAPSDTSYLWLDISLDPPLLKRYDPEKAAWVIVNDTTDIVYNLEQNLLATIQVTEQNIQSIVSESYTLKDEADALISSVSTEIEQTKNSVEIQFNQFSAELEAVAAGTDAEFEEIKKYIRFEEGNIIQGAEGSPFQKVQSATRESYFDSGKEVAYFSNQMLHVTDGEFTHSLRLGKFAFVPRANGNLSFKKVVE
jgi:hypothetical protein